MSFRSQLQVDSVVFSSIAEFADAAVLTIASGVSYDVKIVRANPVDRLPVEFGQADMDTFEVFKKNSADSFVISPNDKIVTADGVSWTVQVGTKTDSLFGSWLVPVISDRRAGL